VTLYHRGWCDAKNLAGLLKSFDTIYRTFGLREFERGSHCLLFLYRQMSVNMTLVFRDHKRRRFAYEPEARALRVVKALCAEIDLKMVSGWA
jgi:predicted Ser/Thr protein kinase